MDAGGRTIDVPEGDLLRYAHERIRLRDGFLSFVEGCRERNWPFHVVSCGLDWYLRAFLPADIPFISYAGVHADGWRVSLPSWCALPEGADFKVHALADLRRRYPGHASVFIGDGRNDLPVARLTDRVFAVKGSALARLCARHEIAHETFQSFDEIGRRLMAQGAAFISG
jgi:2-hydroxy-3-keto-5-methylthiopentenyl-1-phosphate phosphatase